MWATVLKQQKVGFAGGWPGTGHRDPPPTLSLGILWLPAAKPPLIGIDIRQMAVGPARADPAGGLGQADPNPHAGVWHKGARAPRPGTCVPPVLLKRHVADALAKAGEDVGDLSGEGEPDGEDLWAPLPPPGQMLPDTESGPAPALGTGNTAV